MRLLRTPDPVADRQAIQAALARAALALGRLDQASAGHPLLPALLHRSRLEAARRHAAVDGEALDPWDLAALLADLPIRLDTGATIAEAAGVLGAARAALARHAWLDAPDFDQEGEIQAAERALARHATGDTPLLAAADGLLAWLEAGGRRDPARAALVRVWIRHGLLRAPLPLTGAAALRAAPDPDGPPWAALFLDALAAEADATRALLASLERGLQAARAAVAGRRRHSRAPAAVLLLATAPLLSAGTLAAQLGMAPENAGRLLEEFRRLGVAVEVSHRRRGRLYGLAGLAPLRERVAPPRRPQPGRRPGRPRLLPEAPAEADPLPPLSPPAPTVRAAFGALDYAALEEAVAFLDATNRRTAARLAALASPAAPHDDTAEADEA